MLQLAGELVFASVQTRNAPIRDWRKDGCIIVLCVIWIHRGCCFWFSTKARVHMKSAQIIAKVYIYICSSRGHEHMNKRGMIAAIYRRVLK